MKKDFTIWWTGTTTGTSTVMAETLEEAILKASHPDEYPDVDESIDIEDYPDDWTIDEGMTESMNKNTFLPISWRTKTDSFLDFSAMVIGIQTNTLLIAGGYSKAELNHLSDDELFFTIHAGVVSGTENMHQDFFYAIALKTLLSDVSNGVKFDCSRRLV